MTKEPQSAVYDCNVLLGAILSTKGADFACWRLVEDGSVTLILSAQVLSELRRTPHHPDLQRFKFLTPERVEAFIAELVAKARMIDQVPIQFEYKRDPDDAHYINLALAAKAVYVISRDNDLRDLMDPKKPEAKEFHRRFPQLRIMEPKIFVNEIQKIALPQRDDTIDNDFGREPNVGPKPNQGYEPER